jgi:hypothetical protein
VKHLARILLLAFLPVFGVADIAVSAQKSSVAGLPCDPANLLPGCKPVATIGDTGQPSLMSLLSKPLQDLANFLQSDFAGAEELSTAIPALQDGNGQACWAQMKSAGAVFKQHPLPLTLKAATDLEALRLLIITANNTCNNTACTQVFTEAGNLVQSIVSTAAGALSTPLPNLTVLCSKLPPISVVAPSLPVTPVEPAKQ